MTLEAPEGLSTRPVLDRVKESWFAVLGERVAGASVLDLYAGVGSLGIEALSRGAASCVFVERSRECLSMLRAHLTKAKLADRARIVEGRVEAALVPLAASDETFDVVFVDPPFAVACDAAFLAPDGILASVPSLLAKGGPAGDTGGVAQPGLLMLRHEAPRRGGRKDPPGLEGARLVDRRAWGRNEVVFWERA